MADIDLNVTLAQLNPVAGDVAGNAARIRETYLDADARGADVAVFPELCVSGCPLEGLADNADLLAAVEAELRLLRAATAGRRAALVAGAPIRAEDGSVRSAGLAFADGGTAGMAVAGTGPARAIPVNGTRIGLLVGEDALRPEAVRVLRGDGAETLVSLRASPFRPGSLRERVREAAEAGLPVIQVNIVGGQDEVVFDGGSFCLDSRGRIALRLPQWEECVMDRDAAQAAAEPDDDFPDALEEIWRAMTLGLADYAGKSGFTDVLLGLSGGMDSALVAAVAGDALGAEHVHCLRLPSRYTSALSNSSAEAMCRIWGFSMETAAIGGVVEAGAAALGPLGGELRRLTLENMQARARGYLLMTLSNDRGWLLLSTGNKSEISVGYATLYGDMCGGYNPIKDVFKTTVFALAEWRNANRPAGLKGPVGVVIPPEIIARPPSAELAPGQLDTDSLPPYPELDAILAELLEKGTPLSALAAKGFDAALARRVYSLVKRAEYKRRQGAPGVMLGGSPAGRLPMVNGFDPQ